MNHKGVFNVNIYNQHHLVRPVVISSHIPLLSLALPHLALPHRSTALSPSSHLSKPHSHVLSRQLYNISLHQGPAIFAAKITKSRNLPSEPGGNGEQKGKKTSEGVFGNAA